MTIRARRRVRGRGLGDFDTGPFRGGRAGGRARTGRVEVSVCTLQKSLRGAPPSPSTPSFDPSLRQALAHTGHPSP